MDNKFIKNIRYEVAIRELNKRYKNLHSYQLAGQTVYVDENDKMIFRVSPNKENLVFNEIDFEFFETFMGFEHLKLRYLIVQWFNETYKQRIERLMLK